jgi:AcrR family transcriptional regulator
VAAIAAHKRTVSPPLQARSRETYDRILDALEELLQVKRFEEITVRELVGRSGTSTGSFYARFPTKETLLPALYDRYDAKLHAAVARSERKAKGTLEETVRDIIDRSVTRMRDRRWLMRAVALHARQHPELITGATRARRNALHAKWRAELLRFRHRFNHPDPETAVAFGLFMTITACREKIVFADAPHASSFDLPAERLIEESARALLMYLGVDESGPVIG